MSSPTTTASPLRQPWRHRFADLGPVFATAQSPTPLPAVPASPYWVACNRGLARELGLDDEWLAHDEVLHALAGHGILPGTRPVASVYSGHQFGVWAGQLGDGRALLLGELPCSQPDANGWHEVQLKGAGRTPYSRMGDGRAVLRSSIREFLCSEAMHALGIPTTRALALVGSDAPVQRETVESAAVLTRTAPSLIRFGHFEHFAAMGNTAALRQLADFVIDHFYPACRSTANPYAALLRSVTERTAALLAQWQAVGFCHGVMNTDNMSILGLTLDYGPFQFLDAYDPGHVCNHSDSAGRYAYARQPQIAYWNLFCLGQALLPLLDDQQQALDALEPYQTLYPQAFAQRMQHKLGLSTWEADDSDWLNTLLRVMAQDQPDHTLFWRQLSHAVASDDFTPVQALFQDPQTINRTFNDWLTRYRQRLSTQPRELTALRMLQTNPRYVLRNHLGEIAIRAARHKDFSEVHRLHTVLARPFDEQPEHAALADVPPAWAADIAISCSS